MKNQSAITHRPLKFSSSSQLDIKDFHISLFLFAAISTIGIYKVIPRLWDAGGFNVDCYIATAIARNYLFRPAWDLQIYDLYTQGFVHPLLYVPILGLLRALGMSPQIQDNIAIAFVFAVALGFISVLAYICARAYLIRPAAIVTPFLGLYWLLIKSDSDAVSPNGEILGSVLLLFFWALLIYRKEVKYWLEWAIGIGAVVFHLKYQLIPQLITLSLFNGIGKIQRINLLKNMFIISITVDLIVYRLSGSGILSQAYSLGVDYFLLGEINGNSHVKYLMTDAFHGTIRMIAYSPQILVAWSAWLIPLLSPYKSWDTITPDLVASAAITVATLIAIMLPGKYFNHHSILLLPSTFFVLVMALKNTGLVSK